MVSFRSKVALNIGKICYLLLRISGRHATTLPGLITEKLSPKILEELSGQLSNKLIVVTGTNGKTSTVKILKALLSRFGICVSNDSGSNFTRGIITSLVLNASLSGHITADFVVLETDEAYAPVVCETLKPKVLVALNVLRDQLDRYGEIETTAEFIQKSAVFSTTIIANALDPLLIEKLESFKDKLKLFGAVEEVSQQIVNETNLFSNQRPEHRKIKNTDAKITTYKFDAFNNKSMFSCQINDVEIEEIIWSIHGAHNAMNACAALLAAAEFIQIQPDTIKEVLKALEPAYGRGELINYRDKKIVLNLVKNPSGFNQNIQTYLSAKSNYDTAAIFINDRYADGRDVSWLWDVNLTKLKTVPSILVGGLRKFDMALCLEYNYIGYEILSDDSVSEQLKQLLADESKRKIIIFATYTAMLEIRDILKRKSQG